MIVDGYEIDEEGSATDEGGEEGSSTHHLTDPVLTCTETTQHNDSIRNTPAKDGELLEEGVLKKINTTPVKKKARNEFHSTHEQSLQEMLRKARQQQQHNRKAKQHKHNSPESHFSKKNGSLGWDSNPRSSALQLSYTYMYVWDKGTCLVVNCLTSHFGVESSTKVPIEWRGGSIEENGCA